MKKRTNIKNLANRGPFESHARLVFKAFQGEAQTGKKIIKQKNDSFRNFFELVTSKEQGK